MVLVAVSVLLAPSKSLGQSATENEPNDEAHFLDRIGFTFDVDAGYSLRFNGYSTYPPLLQTQIPVDYDTKVFSVLDLHLAAGILRGHLVEFDYQTSIPRTEFQEEALAYRTDRTSGLEKYTFGIDTTPLWLLILPEDASWFVKRILALRFRSIRELAQSNARVTESSLRIPAETEITDYRDPASFEAVADQSSYSFRTRYRYNSITLPIAFFVQNRGRLNVGVARWTFSRSYAASLPSLDNRQVIFDATNRTAALVAELYLRLHEGPLDGFDMSLYYGYGVKSEWSGGNVDLDRLFFPGGDTSLDNRNHNYEIRVSHRFTFFENKDRFGLSVRPGMIANTFTTTFRNFKNSEDESYEHARNPSDTFRKLDWILNPSVRISLRY